MKTREFRSSDYQEIRDIHRIFYGDKFPLPDFASKEYINTVVIVNDNDEIISCAGIRPLLEVVAVTNKGINTKDKIAALSDILAYSIHTAKTLKVDSLHAFIQDDEKWIKHLKQFGFSEINGKGLVLHI